MKKILLFTAVTGLIILTACGPAAEDREKMHTRAKVFQDSIANFIRVSMAEAEAPSPNRAVPVPQSTAATQPTPGQPNPQPVTPNVDVNRTK